MPNFIMIYKGDSTDMSEMTEEQQSEVMQKWGAWMGKVGDALVDIGSPFGPGTSLVDDGSEADPAAASGYTIVAASDLEEAKGFADGHPYLSEGNGNYAIDIFALMPTPEM